MSKKAVGKETKPKSKFPVLKEKFRTIYVDPPWVTHGTDFVRTIPVNEWLDHQNALVFLEVPNEVHKGIHLSTYATGTLRFWNFETSLILAYKRHGYPVIAKVDATPFSQSPERLIAVGVRGPKAWARLVMLSYVGLTTFFPSRDLLLSALLGCTHGPRLYMGYEDYTHAGWTMWGPRLSETQVKLPGMFPREF